MSLAVPTYEERLSFHGYKVWYRIVGEHEAPGKLPLLVLHGGPGGSHDSVEALEALAATGRRVIFYDQLGGGKSDHPHDPALWTMDLFVEEVGVVRRALGLERLHLWGLCWGGILAMEYVLTQPDGLASLVVAGAYASVRQWVVELERLCADLPPEGQQAIMSLIHADDEADASGCPASPEASMSALFYRLLFLRRHFCRLRTWPDCIARSQPRAHVLKVMSGPNEFCVNGRLKDWDIVDRLGEIEVPTLLTSGRYDYVPPACMETIHRGIRGAQWVIFERSAHMAHLEEPERYMQVLDAFLTRVEAPA